MPPFRQVSLTFGEKEKILKKNLFPMMGLLIALTLFWGGRAESANFADLIDGKNVKWGQREYRIALAKSIESLLKTFDLGIPNVSPEQKNGLLRKDHVLTQLKKTTRE